MKSFNIEELKNDLLNKRIVIYPSNKFNMGGRFGIVTEILSNTKIKGTWSNEIVNVNTDIFEVIGETTLLRDKYIKK